LRRIWGRSRRRGEIIDRWEIENKFGLEDDYEMGIHLDE
jgi:hypothetical protein